MAAARGALRILVTGAHGQVGWELQRELAPLGAVTAIDREELDLTRPDAIREYVRALRPGLIVNPAAYTAVDKAESEPAPCAAINATAPGVLAEEAARLGAAIVHYSTDYVFDGSKQSPYVETDAPNPLGVYGRTKLDGERAVAAAGAPHVILRTSWVYGRRGKNFLLTMLALARQREELRIVCDQVGAPTWSRALASATAAIVARLAGDRRGLAAAAADVSGTYHLTASGETSWHGFAEAILELDPRREEQRCRRVVPIATAAYPTPARRPASSRMDCSRAADVLGVRIPDWREQLALVMAE